VCGSLLDQVTDQVKRNRQPPGKIFFWIFAEIIPRRILENNPPPTNDKKRSLVTKGNLCY
jgi:hypothetical protein